MVSAGRKEWVITENNPEWGWVRTFNLNRIMREGLCEDV